MKTLAHCIFVAALLAYAWAPAVQAQSDERVFSEYQYDEVGNEISRTQERSGAAPNVDTVTPAIVRQNQTLLISLTGQGLRGAQLGDQNPFFTFSDISSTDQALSFTLAVDGDAEQGPAQVSVSTGLGTAFFSLNVLSELPDLRLAPSPLVLTPGTVQTLDVSLSFADVLDHTVSVSVANSAVASVSVNQLQFTQGNLRPASSLVLTAQSVGVTTLTFESEGLDDQRYTVRVANDEIVLEPGSTQSFNSPAVGLTKLFTPPPPDLIEQGPFTAELRINKLFSAPDVASSSSAFANSVGVLKGNHHLRPNPNAIGAGVQNLSVTVQGQGLNNVDTVTLTPSDNTQISNISAAADGAAVNFDVSVDAATPLSLRELALNDSTGRIPAAGIRANRLYIGGAAPVVESVSPIFLNRGDVRTITVRGTDLQTVRGVRFDNNDNLVFSSPTVAEDGRSLTFGLEVVGFAILGPRRLILDSLLGDSTALHSAANVINLEDNPPRDLTPVVSPLVGVERQINSASQPTENTARAQLVGVSRGNLLTAIIPNSRAQGSSVTLALQGEGLDDVIAVEFEPAQGITVGAYTANADGSSASLDITIANDADPSPRRVSLVSDTGDVNALARADRFTVTLPRPQIESVSPLLIDRSQGLVPITIRGDLLNNATIVSVIPPTGVTVSLPVSSADGRRVSAVLTVASNAPLTPRIIQVTTPGGSTESAAMLSNTVRLVDQIDAVLTPITSAQVGVVREVTPVPQTQTLNALSVGIGVVRETTPVINQQTNSAFANNVGITKGPAAFSLAPMNLPINTQNQTIEVLGTNLDNVTTVQTIPADGVALTGPAIISADGTRVTFSASVADDAPQVPRRLELVTATGVVPFATPNASQLLITGLQPQLESIEPIQQVRGANFTLTLRGINLTGAQAVQAAPANGIQFGTPSVAADGRSLTVPVVIDPTAATQQVVISVTTAAGITTASALPENTFTIISE